MSVQTQIDRIDGNVKNALATIAEKGVTVPTDANSDDLETLIDAIATGGGGYASGDIVKAWQTSDLTVGSGYSSISVSYGSEVTNSDGTLSLGGTTGSVTVSSADNCEVLKGQYIKPSGSYTSTSTAIYYIPEDATFTYSGSTYSKNCKVDKAHQMFVLA